MMKALYAGSFDPVTYGHWDIIVRGSRIFDELVVVVATNSKKSYLFSAEERKHLIESQLQGYPNVKVVIHNGLTVEVAKRMGCQTIIRGLRPHGDFESEYGLALINSGLAPGIETMFLIAKPDLIAVSSSAVKELARYNQDIDQYVDLIVARAIQKKLLISAEE